MKENKATPSKAFLFGAWDIIAYFVLALTIVALFVFFIVVPKTSTTKGFKIMLNGKQIATYDYSLQKLNVLQEYSGLIVEQGQTLTVYTDNQKSHFNVLIIDAKNNSVKVSESNCSTSKDCVYTPALSGTNGAIVCAPHGIKIVPIDSSGLTPPQTGGLK